MTDTQQVPNRKLGRKPTDPARLARTVRLKLTGTLPAVPASADHITGVGTGWMMGGNDKYGTCGPTSVANYLVLLYKNLAGETITVTDDAIFDLYRRSGNPDFDPAADADDNGVDMTVLLSALVSGGIEITRANGTAETVKPYCFAAVDTAIADVRAVTDIFGAALLAVDLQTAQQAQSDARPPLWDYSKSGDWGGHAICGGSYTSATAKGQRDETVISWQEPVGTTDAFWSHQGQEAYVVVFPLLWGTPAFQAGVDDTALVADFEAVTGKPWTGPTPGNGPAPVPAPTPTPAPSDPDAALWAATEEWAKGRHAGANETTAKALTAWGAAKNFS